MNIDNSKENLVNLLYKDHILAHYYLFNCALGELKQKLSNAMIRFYSKPFKDDIYVLGDLNKRQFLYGQCMQYVAELNRKNNSIPVQCLETGEVFESAAQAEVKFKGYPTSNITMATKLPNNTAYGYHWVKIQGAPYTEYERNQLLSSIPPQKKKGKRLGSKQSKETKLKISSKVTGMKRDASTIEKMSKAQKLRHKNNPTTQETIDKRVVKLKGLKRSEEQKANMRKPHNYVMSDSHKENIINSHKGKSWHSSPHSEISKQKIRQSMTEFNVQNLETGEIFLNSAEADVNYRSKSTGNVEQSCISLKNGGNKSAYGYHWVRIPKNSLGFSKEEREQILNSMPKIAANKRVVKVKCLETQEIFNSMAEAGRKYNCNVKNCLNDSQKTAGGYHWVSIIGVED